MLPRSPRARGYARPNSAFISCPRVPRKPDESRGSQILDQYWARGNSRILVHPRIGVLGHDCLRPNRKRHLLQKASETLKGGERGKLKPTLLARSSWLKRSNHFLPKKNICWNSCCRCRCKWSAYLQIRFLQMILAMPVESRAGFCKNDLPMSIRDRGFRSCRLCRLSCPIQPAV